eukprot:2528112-Rhodomonas_salina.2
MRQGSACLLPTSFLHFSCPSFLSLPSFKPSPSPSLRTSLRRRFFTPESRYRPDPAQCGCPELTQQTTLPEEKKLYTTAKKQNNNQDKGAGAGAGGKFIPAMKSGQPMQGSKGLTAEELAEARKFITPGHSPEIKYKQPQSPYTLCQECGLMHLISQCTQ